MKSVAFVIALCASLAVADPGIALCFGNMGCQIVPGAGGFCGDLNLTLPYHVCKTVSGVIKLANFTFHSIFAKPVNGDANVTLFFVSDDSCGQHGGLPQHFDQNVFPCESLSPGFELSWLNATVSVNHVTPFS